MFGVGLPELMLLAVVAMLAFGPDKLPEFARQAGRLVRQVQDFTQATREELRNEFGPEFADLGLDGLSAMSGDPATHTRSAWVGSTTSSSGDQRRPKGPGAASYPESKSTLRSEPSPEGPNLCSEAYPDGSSLASPSNEPTVSKN